MSTAARRVETVAKPVTIAEFDAFVDTQNHDTKYELIDGVIVMMTNPTGTHEQIAANIAAPLKLAMDARGCNTYIGGMRVQRSENVDDTDKTIPDIVVHCSPVSSLTYITDPIVVV
ncbi:MAG: Uma2 family endonuclease, partial [Hyphomicrobiaceae bacterium]